ncbi:MAG: penicillin-binding protein [Candidatus Pacebacteria bacterium]|nr:penicillin-binding protein [Candidatus Paceibacterota bacterium]
MQKNYKNSAWKSKKIANTPKITQKPIKYHPRSSRKQKQKKSLLKRFFTSATLWKTIGVLILLGIVGFFAVIAWFSRGLPDPNQLISRDVPQSTIIYDRTGENILYEIHGEEKRTLVTLEEIPDYVEKTTIAIEDKNFYQHSGFSLFAIFRTAVTNILYHRKAGGSTLTQQLIKNAVLSSEKSYSRKIKELILAYKLEQKFSKDEILQMYLNEIPYGSNAYGVQAASEKYFGKAVQEITVAEAAVLAALPQAPSFYSPYGTNKDSLLARKNYILDLMEKQGYINNQEKETAKNQEIVFNKPTTDITAPHFVMYVKQILSEKYGEKNVEKGGLKIYTTLDLYKQKIAEEVISEFAEKNQEKYDAENASLVAIDPKTGQVLAMVGSKDYFSEEIDGQFNVAISPRQPGSSLKPLVYASLFEKGYNPNTILFDVLTNFSNNSEPYEPRNYNNKELGPVSIRKALAGSLNIPAVKAVYLSGMDNVLNLAENAGYTTLKDRDRFGLSLVLGGAEVKLIEHVNAYSAFAREGEVSPISVILKIEDKDGNVLEEYKENKKTILPTNIARLINSVLSDNEARAYAFGVDNHLRLSNRPVAAKTGTTNNYRDAWTVGYTPSLVAGVWVGNNDNTEMRAGAAGGTVAAPIWNTFMTRVLGDTPVEEFKNPEIKITDKEIIDGTITFSEKIKIDSASGLLATENTPEELVEEKEFFNYHNILFYVDKESPLGDSPEKPENDPQFVAWETAINNWVEKENQRRKDSGEELILLPPTESDNLHLPENKPVFSINLKNNSTIQNSMLAIEIEASAPRGIDSVSYYINNNLLATKTSYPFNLREDIGFLKNGLHKLSVKVCDNVLNCSEKELAFNYLGPEKTNNEASAVNIAFPFSGLALNEIDFPLQIKSEISNPLGISSLELKIQNQETKNIEDIKTYLPINSSSETLNWQSPPLNGSYLIWLKANTWEGTSVESNKVELTIN